MATPTTTMIMMVVKSVDLQESAMRKGNPNGTGSRSDIKTVECPCLRRFRSSFTYKDHMRLEHPGKPLEELVYK